jgi:hypothetical protein
MISSVVLVVEDDEEIALLLERSCQGSLQDQQGEVGRCLDQTSQQ